MAVKELSSPERCDHRNVIDKLGYIFCEDCAAVVPTQQLIEVWTSYHRMVSTGIAVLTDELEKHREDARIASNELMVPIPPLDSTDVRDDHVRRMLRANAQMRRERSDLRAKVDHYHSLASRLCSEVIEFQSRIHPSIRDTFVERLVGTARYVLQVLCE